MELAACYRLLGLRRGASYEEIKTSYRRLARKYHPDVNPDNRQQAQEKFIQITAAYELLVAASEDAPRRSPQPRQPRSHRPSQATPPTSPQATSVVPSATPPAATPRKRPTIRRDPETPPTDYQFKVDAYDQTQRLLQERRFPRAIALLEGLQQRLPNDREVRQWLAIAYYKWGNYLIATHETDKARLYLNKALRTAPDYKELWYEVDRALQKIDAEFL